MQLYLAMTRCRSDQDCCITEMPPVTPLFFSLMTVYSNCTGSSRYGRSTAQRSLLLYNTKWSMFFKRTRRVVLCRGPRLRFYCAREPLAPKKLRHLTMALPRLRHQWKEPGNLLHYDTQLVCVGPRCQQTRTVDKKRWRLMAVESILG